MPKAKSKEKEAKPKEKEAPVKAKDVPETKEEKRKKKFNEQRLSDKAYLAKSLKKDKLQRRLEVCNDKEKQFVGENGVHKF